MPACYGKNDAGDGDRLRCQTGGGKCKTTHVRVTYGVPSRFLYGLSFLQNGAYFNKKDRKIDGTFFSQGEEKVISTVDQSPKNCRDSGKIGTFELASSKFYVIIVQQSEFTHESAIDQILQRFSVAYR
jgi:hypothetical protein